MKLSPLMQLSRLKGDWTQTDWMDFWATLNAFAERVLARRASPPSEKEPT